MQLVKPFLDVALFTTAPEALRAFWQESVGATFDHILPIATGHEQHRMDLYGSVLKINAVEELPRVAPAGYTGLVVAHPAATTAQTFSDPDGNRVTLAPRGYRGVDQIGIVIGVRDQAAHAAFMADALGLEQRGADHFRVGNSSILLEQDDDAPADAAGVGPGWRYITVQIRDVAAEQAHCLAHGGTLGMPVRQLGDVARFAMVRDPDGNWIELSQRASLTGPLGAFA